MSAFLRRAAVLSLALLGGAAAQAQPVNDAFATPTNLGNANPANATGSNVGATKEAGEPNHGGAPGGRSAWWQWTAPASGLATVSTSGSNFDTLLGVYTGAAVAALTFVAGNDDTPAAYIAGVSQKTSLVTFNATGGVTYRIAVDGFFNAAGSVSLSITLAAGTAPPSLSISDTSLSEQDFGATTASFNVTLSAATTVPVTVAYATGGGTATAGVDYAATSGTLHFSPGTTAGVVNVAVIGDAAVEGNETFNVTLSAPTNAVIADGTGVGTIVNDDGVASTSTDLGWQTGNVSGSGFPGMPTIHGSTFGNALFVLVGDYGDIWTSPDTSLWTLRANPDGSLRPLRGVTFGGGTFVAVGGCCNAMGGGGLAGGAIGGTILTSTNGTSWTYRGALTEQGLHGVAFGNGRFVAVGARGTVIGSINAGVDWQFAAVQGTPDFMGVAFGGGAFVAVGERGTIIQSVDGTNWAQGAIGTEDLRAVTHTGSQFVAVGASGTILTSPDGLTWTTRASGTEASLSGVTTGAGTIVAVGATAILTSTNGTSWTPRGIPAIDGVSTALRTVTFGAGAFIAAGDDGTFYGSLDSVTWSALTFLTSGQYRAVAFNGTNTYCAIGNAGSVASSADGVAWTLRGGLAFPMNIWHWKSVASSGGVFVAVGNGAEIMSSADCVTWTERNAGATTDPATGIAGHLSDVTFGGGVFAAVGEEMPNAGEGVALVATSPDGTTWTQRAVSGLTTDEHALTAVSQGGGRFVALGMNRATGRPVSAVSTDGGLTWTGQGIAAFDPYEEVNDLAFGNGVFVAVGDRIWTSPDGNSWTLRRGYAGTPLRSVSFGNGRFMAAGDLGTLLGSEDGSFWAANLQPAFLDLYGIVAGPAGSPDLLVAVGDSVIQSSGTPTRPPNDNLANATAVAGTFSVSGSNVFGTKEPGEPSHAGGQGGRSVWWSWTAPQSGKAMVRTLGSGFDTLLGVYTGATIPTLVLVGSNDDFTGVTSRVRFDATAGTTYRFAVDGFGGAVGAITISGGMAPPNDDFAERIDLPAFTTGTTGSSVNATYEASEPFHAGNAGGRSVWWNWTAPASGTVTISTAGSTFNTLLAVYTGNVSRLCAPPGIQPPNCLTQIAANDDQGGGPTTSLVTFSAVAGTAYRIAVDGSNGASGSVTLGLTLTVPPPAVFINDVTVTEGQSGTKLATFTVSLSGASNLTITANYSTSNGTATAGSDYVAVPAGLVTFAPGQTSQPASVTVNGDTTVEPDETFLVTLTNPVNATLTGGDPQGVGTIANDDTQVSIGDVTVVEPLTGTRDAVFPVTLSPPLTASSVTVQYSTANGTATSPADYAGVAGGTVTIPANTATQNIAVAIQADAQKEGTETFTVTLSNPSAGATISRATGTGVIYDPGNLFTVTPCRLADTRGAEGPALSPGADRTFAVAGRCGVPASARAASVNITVTQPTDPGDLRLYPAGDAPPLASAINYSPGQTRANNAVLPLGVGGQIAIRLDQGAGSVHFILDVNGYLE